MEDLLSWDLYGDANSYEEYSYTYDWDDSMVDSEGITESVRYFDD